MKKKNNGFISVPLYADMLSKIDGLARVMSIVLNETEANKMVQTFGFTDNNKKKYTICVSLKRNES